MMDLLRNVFPDCPQETIQELIDLAKEEMGAVDDQTILERVVTLLTDYNGFEPPNNPEDVHEDNLFQPYNPEDFQEDEAVGGIMIEEVLIDQVIIKESLNDYLKTQLKERFPDACPFYIDDVLSRDSTTLDYDTIEEDFRKNGYAKINPKVIARNAAKKKEEAKTKLYKLFPNASHLYINNCIEDGLDFDLICDKFTTEGYVQMEVTNQKQQNELNQLRDMFPRIDPDFLLGKIENFSSDNALVNCITELEELKEFPTKAEYDLRQAQKQKLLNYLFKFKIDDFLIQFDNDLSIFDGARRKHSLEPTDSTQTNQLELHKDRIFAQIVLQSVYKSQSEEDIDYMLKKYNYDLIKCCRELGEVKKIELHDDQIKLPVNSYTNELLFQELAFIINKSLIINYLGVKTKSYDKAYEQAKAANLLKECNVCYENGLLLMPEKCYQCSNGCTFCKDCMTSGCQVVFSDGLLDINCFAKCGGKFSDLILFNVMDKTSYGNLMRRKQIKEILDANVDGVETCPFCDYATVMAKEDKIFSCKNPKCGKEACRECRHESHIPLRCNEIEYDEDVKMRTFIENQMTQALLRTCTKCQRQFIKETGCNKMTCQCGQTMCYICGMSGIGYEHFGNKCILFTNQEELHRRNVVTAANSAKVTLGVDKNPNKLKFDPSKNI